MNYLPNDLSFDDLTSRVKQELNESLEAKKYFLTQSLKFCESPIEQLLAIYLPEYVDQFIIENSKFGKEIDAVVKPQTEVSARGHKYRLDFNINVLVDRVSYDFAIECDGHAFHEKTKEQARRDKQRTRDLQTSGFTVIRFTGSEINENPRRCCLQVLNIIEQETGMSDLWDEEIKRAFSKKE